MPCKGLHCGGCNDGGGAGLVLVVVVVLIVIGARAAEGVAPAVSEAVHVLEVVLEVVLITMASVAGIGILTVLGWAGLRVYRWRAGRLLQAQTKVDALEVAPTLIHAEVIAPGRQGIEAPKPRLDMRLADQPDYIERK